MSQSRRSISPPRARREVAEGGGETSEPIQGEPEFGEGIIEISGKGFGFLRDPKRNFVQTAQDIFVTPEIVRRFALARRHVDQRRNPARQPWSAT